VATATSAASFAPAQRPRLAVASDGTLAAVHEPSRVSVIELPGAAMFAEVGIDPEASASDIAWVGAPPRLLVLSRYAAHSVVHLLDPYGPRTLAEIRLESAMKLYATVGSHALAVGPLGAAVLTASDTHLTPYQFPARALPVAGGAAGGQFVVGLAASIEEWDPHSRIPKRRIKLPRAGALTAVGGSDRVVWWTTQGDPACIEVSPLVNRGQPRSHQLPERPAHISAHPRSDLIVCVGAETGRVYVIDLDGRQGMRVIGPEGIDRAETAGLVVGRVVGVLAAQARHPVRFVSLERRDVDPPPAVAVADGDRQRDTHTEVQARPSTLLEAPAAPPAAAPPVDARFAAWRARVGEVHAKPGPVAVDWAEEHTSWRDALAGWARAVAAGTIERDAPPAPLIDELVARLELAAPLRAALALLYGTHLVGEPGAAPVDVARVVGRHWDEALGRGQLAERGAAVYRDSRVRLAPALLRVLDELEPRTGTLIGTPARIALLGPCVVVSPEAALHLVAETYAPTVGGAILAAHAHADPRELFGEARAFGAVPMLRVVPGALDRIPADQPVVLVTADLASADELGIPKL
jgi:hypothetical protein